MLRALLTPALLDRLLASIDQSTAGAVPVLEVPDSLKTVDRNIGVTPAVSATGPDRTRTVLRSPSGLKQIMRSSRQFAAKTPLPMIAPPRAQANCYYRHWGKIMLKN